MDNLFETANQILLKLSSMAPEAVDGLVAMQRASFSVCFQWIWISAICIVLFLFVAIVSFRLYDDTDSGFFLFLGFISAISIFINIIVFIIAIICYSEKAVFEAAPQIYVIKQLL